MSSRPILTLGFRADLSPDADFDRIIKPLLEREPLELDDAEEMDLDDEIDEMKEEREEASRAAREKKADAESIKEEKEPALQEAKEKKE